ncbi:MAG TPA: AAA family ATPase [Labilithrix sp.]|nr:AAA family ATPase [Labilithrix sp.]
MAVPFLGRSRELAQLEELATATLVTLWGPGGVGKTRLAREREESERRRGRVVAWADLAASRTRREVVTTLATTLGVTLVETDDAAIDALAQAATAQRALVVADNLEQIDDAARAALLHLAAAIGEGACLLLTSRERLGAPFEATIAVEPLGEDDGVALFEALAGAPDDPTTRAIVRRLDALPLALELAAARVPLLGAPELLARLDRKLDVLGTARADRPARHATLRAAIAWSWDLLEESERDALVACATFEGPFDAALAEHVIGGAEADALDRLERLRRRALVHAAPDARGRATLRLLESVRDFAREEAAARASRDPDAARALQDRHAQAVLARAEPLAEAAACGRDTLAALEQSRADLEAASRGSGAPAARATLALAALLAISGPASAAVERIDAALARVDVEHRLVSRLLVAKAAACRTLGHLDEARRVLDRVPPCDAPDDDARLADAEAARVRGSVLRSLGDVEHALAEQERALAIYRAIDDRAREGLCLGEIGAAHQSEGRLALARRFHAEAIAIHVAMGSRRAEGVERSYLAVATHRAGDPAAALALHETALAIHREAGHRRLEGAELLHLGFVHHELGALPAAREALGAARRVLAAAGARGLLGIALVLSARLEVDAGDGAAALLLLAEATHAAPASWPRLVATRHLVDGHLAMASGAPDRACVAYEAALASSRDLEVGFEVLTPAYLELARSRAGARSDAEALANARARVATLENPNLRVAFEVLAASASGAPLPEIPAEAPRASSEVRRAMILAGARRALSVEDDGRRVVLPDGRAIDLSRRKNVRLVLLALARARRDAPGTPVLPELLVEAGWPGERMRADAATKRLHTAIWTLRTVGLEGLLLTEGEGYLLDSRTDLRLPGP